MPKKKSKQYSYGESLEMLSKLQQMAIDEGNINLALKAEELKCKIATLKEDTQSEFDNDNLTKILVEFIDDKQKSANSEDFCSADNREVSL